MKFRVIGATPETIVRRAMFLAWKSSRAVGFGVLQNRGSEQSEDQVWKSMFNREDYPSGNEYGDNKPGKVYADYVQGRMMKVGFRWDAETIGVNGGEWRSDYQSFCHAYPNAFLLLTAAASEVGAGIELMDEEPNK